MSAGPTNGQILVHEIGQSFTWEILLNITVILAVVKHSWSAAFLHMAIGICMLALTYFFILWYLIPYGFIQSQKAVLVYYIHAIIGCAMLGFIVLLVSSGLFTRYAVDSPFSKSIKKFVRSFHKIFAYIIIIVFKMNVLFNWYTTNMTVFAVLTSWDITFFFVWTYLKFFKEKLEVIVLDTKARLSAKPIQEVSSLAEIQELKHPYIVYNGHVYDASKLVKHHPGGQKVISSILSREVDRFLYGMYSSELVPDVPPRSHSTSALSLLREPVLKLVTPSPFQGLTEDIIAVKIQFMSAVSKKSKIFIVGLESITGELKFEGYSDRRQLGQYYSLTMGESVSRLYTTVNFLTKQNILLLKRLIPLLEQEINQQKKSANKKLDLNELKQINSGKNESLLESQEKKEYLPIMLKIYDQGKFTAKLESMDPNTARLRLSPPKGFGLQLDITRPGKIVIVAGGTGLFPFCDLIDLLYKSIYLTEAKGCQAQILQVSPLLQSNPFQKWNFVLLAAIQDAQDIHPITAHQLAFLSKHPSKFKAVLRVSSNEQFLKDMDSKFEFTREYFTNRAITESSDTNFSRAWICGPPKMCTEVASNFLKHGFSRDSFLLL